MLAKDKKEFDFDIVYFKENGKFYSNEIYTYKCRYDDGGDNGGHEHPYMNDVVAHIRGLRDCEGSKLPGLVGNWSGYITIQWKDSYPTLIIAKDTDGQTN